MKNTVSLDTRGDGRHYCSVCKQPIPKGIPRLRIFIHAYRDGWSRHKKYKSICGLCIKNFNKNLNKRKMEKVKEEWNMNQVVKKL